MTGGKDNLFICQVCSGPCSKYLHYGARACMGCRAFFRRARQDKRCCAILALKTKLSYIPKWINLKRGYKIRKGKQ